MFKSEDPACYKKTNQVSKTFVNVASLALSSVKFDLEHCLLYHLQQTKGENSLSWHSHMIQPKHDQQQAGSWCTTPV